MGWGANLLQGSCSAPPVGRSIGGKSTLPQFQASSSISRLRAADPLITLGCPVLNWTLDTKIPHCPKLDFCLELGEGAGPEGGGGRGGSGPKYLGGMTENLWAFPLPSIPPLPDRPSWFRANSANSVSVLLGGSRPAPPRRRRTSFPASILLASRSWETRPAGHRRSGGGGGENLRRNLPFNDSATVSPVPGQRRSVSTTDSGRSPAAGRRSRSSPTQGGRWGGVTRVPPPEGRTLDRGAQQGWRPSGGLLATWAKEKSESFCTHAKQQLSVG